jgi:hypothetical protein
MGRVAENLVNWLGDRVSFANASEHLPLGCLSLELRSTNLSALSIPLQDSGINKSLKAEGLSRCQTLELELILQMALLVSFHSQTSRDN